MEESYIYVARRFAFPMSFLMTYVFGFHVFGDVSFSNETVGAFTAAFLFLSTMFICFYIAKAIDIKFFSTLQNADKYDNLAGNIARVLVFLSTFLLITQFQDVNNFVGIIVGIVATVIYEFQWQSSN